MNEKLRISVLDLRLAICRLPTGSPIPAWATAGRFASITPTSDELSIVCEEHLVPAGVQAERARRALKVEGPLPFSMTGVLSAISTPLAQAKISIFAISTYDTDYILVNEAELEAACGALIPHFAVTHSKSH